MTINAEKGNTTIYINDIAVFLPTEFVSGLIIQDKYIVLLKKEYSKANIFAFDDKGQKLWQVEENPSKSSQNGYQLIDPTFSTTGKFSNSFVALVGGSWIQIDADNGKLIKSFGDYQKTIYYNKPNNWLQKILKVFR